VSLKLFFALAFSAALFSCRPDAPRDVIQPVDPSFVEGLKSMKDRPADCGEDPSARKTSKITIDPEGKVEKDMTLCIIIDKEAGSISGQAGCMQLLYFGPYSEEIVTEPYYNDNKAEYYFSIRLIDTVKWVSYAWRPDWSVPVKDEMSIRLNYQGDKSDHIEFE
jgi:hypothetical protein